MPHFMCPAPTSPRALGCSMMVPRADRSRKPGGIAVFSLQIRWTACLLLAIACQPSDAAPVVPPTPPKFSHGVLIRLQGPITPGLQHYLYRKLDAAQEDGADLVILEIDSPGGLLDESLAIAARLRNLSWAHTVAYVPREALSGAAIIALGCDEILMAREARLGDAGPIVFGEDALFRHAPEKIVSDLAVRMRSLAKAKGRPPALAEAMVDRDLTVHRVENIKTRKVDYLSNRELAEQPDQWKKLGSVESSGRGRFLEVAGAEAVTLGLADAVVSSREQLAARYSLEDLRVLNPGGMDTAIDILNSGWVTGLLLVLGLIGLYIEFTAPGTGIGGLLAAACFALLFWSHLLGGTAGWLQVVLFLLGVGFIVVELFILPGTMVAGVAGAVLILISVVMVTQGFLVPETARQLHTLSSTLLMILLSCLAFTVAAVVISRRMGTLPVLNRLTLEPPEPDESGGRGEVGAVALTPGSVQVGDLGVAHTALRPGGKARFGDRYVDVMTQGDFLPRGSRIRIVRVSGNQVLVEPHEE